MNMTELYSMRSEEEHLDLGVVYAASEETLRLFGSSYMIDRQTSGTLKILDPMGATIASFDVWQNKWINATDARA